MYWLLGSLEELLPLIAFFVAEAYGGFFAGVIALTISLFVILVFGYYFGRRPPRFAVVSVFLVLLLALMTILTGKPVFFQLSDTIIESILGILLLVSWWRGRPLLKPLFERVFAITDEAWLLLTKRWGIVLLLVALGNEIVRHLYSTDIWTLYKLYSTIFLLLFGCFQFTVSARNRILKESNVLGLRIRK